MRRGRADYGLDRAAEVFALFVGGFFLGAAGQLMLEEDLRAPGAAFLGVGAACVTASLLLLASSKVGRFVVRDRLVRGLGLRGAETVLDLYPGTGVLLVGAARALQRGGRVVGVDAAASVSSQHPALSNARLEGVAAAARLVEGDGWLLPFDSGSVDAVVTGWALHRLDPLRVDNTLAEALRVLRPGGKFTAVECSDAETVAAAAREAGFESVAVSARSWWTLPPVRIVTAAKPASKAPPR